MTWSDHMADLDATAFEHLSDDTAATLLRGGVVLATLPAMLDQVERPTMRHGLAQLDRADVVRISVAALEAEAPGERPLSGDQFTIAGALWTVHGEPWRDEEVARRDWLCPVTGRGL